MPKYFSSACRPPGKCAVERIPQFKEATSPAAYYFPPSLDGKSPGTFFANLRDVEEIVKYKMGSLAYHEAVPGHHFQLSVAQTLKHLPFFRRLIPFTAYMEGWALYTEQLAAEKGFHKSWHSYLGYLDYQLLRSCRFVRLPPPALVTVFPSSLDWSSTPEFIGNVGHVKRPLTTW